MCICCNNSNIWVHKSCLDISLATFDHHHGINKSLTWICPSCHFPSFLYNGFNSWHITDKNIYNSLAHYYNSDDSDTSMIREGSFKPAPNATSTPKYNNENLKFISKNLKIFCINCDSLRSVDKRAELNCLVNHHNPHIILGQEYRLGPDIPSCEIFPKGYKSFRRDRVIGVGGVFILVREDIDHVEDAFPDDNKDSESVWVQLKLFNAKLLNIASFHRPPNSRNDSLALIHNDIGNTMKKYKQMQCVIGGDINLPGFNWLEEEILDGPGKSKCDLFMNMMNEYDLSQHNKEISRPASNNILDLILTNNPSSDSPGM